MRFPSQSGTGRAGTIAFVAAALGLAIAAVLIYKTHERITRLESRLDTAQDWAAFLEKKLNDTEARARESQSEAEQLEEQARELAAAKFQAELEREFAREHAARFEEESALAKEQAEQAQVELEEARRRREDELNRMQKALANIVETVRTPMGMVVNLGEDSFLFDFDKATLRPENREILSRIAGVLLASHGYRLQVYGHTDDVGGASYNKQLSERRAEAVKKYLVDAGVPANLIDAKGYGESSPALAQKSPAARQKNRRVQIAVIDTIINYSGQVAENKPN
jgi:outer membrane protein OmpA-like peptidoglycan-associated protein